MFNKFFKNDSGIHPFIGSFARELRLLKNNTSTPIFGLYLYPI